MNIDLTDNKIRMSKKRMVLLYFADRKRHGNKELSDRFGWSWNQRKNIELKRGGIIINGEMVNGNTAHWEYWLVTPNEDIDFEKCCLKSMVAPSVPPSSQPMPEQHLKQISKTNMKIITEKSGQMAMIWR